MRNLLSAPDVAGRSRTARRTRIAAAAALASVLALAACSSSSSPKAAGSSTAPAAQGQAQAQGGGPDAAAAPGGEKAGAGEAPSVAFTHPTLGYSIDAPGKMVVAADGTASYKGTNDFLTITVVNSPSDPATLAGSDASGTSIPGYQQVAAPHAVTVNGRKGSAFEFTESAGSNAVTGKTQTAHVVRAYLARPGGAYRIEYGSTVSAANWDPQGAMDIVSTFRGGQ